LALKLTLLTMVRMTETRLASWPEFENWERGNINEALWRLSPAWMKMNREHLVPLSRQAIECLHQIKALSKGSEMLFPAPTKSGVFSESAMLYVLYSMGYYGRATVHGLRGTASTILNENEFNSDWIELQLAHHEEDVSLSATSIELHAHAFSRAYDQEYPLPVGSPPRLACEASTAIPLYRTMALTFPVHPNATGNNLQHTRPADRAALPAPRLWRCSGQHRSLLGIEPRRRSFRTPELEVAFAFCLHTL